MDLFRYAAPGVPDSTLGRDGNPAYFSINGTQLLTQFHNPIATNGSNDGADSADWDSSGTNQEPTYIPGQSNEYDAYGVAADGGIGVVTATDLRVLDVIGWTLLGTTSPPPPPPTPTPTQKPLADQPPCDFNGDGTSDILWQNTNGDTAIWYIERDRRHSVQWTLAWSTQAGFPKRPATSTPTARPASCGATPMARSASGCRMALPAAPGSPSSTSAMSTPAGPLRGPATSTATARPTSCGGTPAAIPPSGIRSRPGATARWISASWIPAGTSKGSGTSTLSAKAGIWWRNANGEVGMWLAQPGSGDGFTKLDLGNVSTDWVTQGIGDFNGDHTSDVLWRNTVTGDTAIWFISSNGTYSPCRSGGGGPGLDHSGGRRLQRRRQGRYPVAQHQRRGGRVAVERQAPASPASTRSSWPRPRPAGTSSAATRRPPAARAARRMVHAMAAMGAHSAAPALVPAVARETSPTR